MANTEHVITIDDNGDSVQAFCTVCPKSSTHYYLDSYYGTAEVSAYDYAADDAISELRANVGCTPDGQ